MSNELREQDTSDEQVSHSRRKLMAALALGGGAAAVLPERWMKPVVDSVILPAHAQSSVVINSGFYSTGGDDLPLGGTSTGGANSGRSLLSRVAGYMIGSAEAVDACSVGDVLPNHICLSFDVPDTVGSNVAIVLTDFFNEVSMAGNGTLSDVNVVGETILSDPFSGGGARFTDIQVNPLEVTGFLEYAHNSNVVTSCYQLSVPLTDGAECPALPPART